MLICRSGQVGVEVEVANIPPLLLVLPLQSIPHTPLVTVLPLKQHSPCHSAPPLEQWTLQLLLQLQLWCGLEWSLKPTQREQRKSEDWFELLGINIGVVHIEVNVLKEVAGTIRYNQR